MSAPGLAIALPEGEPPEAQRAAPRRRVLMADDRSFMSAELRRRLDGHCDIVGAVENGRDAVAAVSWLRPEVALLDVSMPVLGGIDATREIRAAMPDAKVLLLTRHSEMGTLQQGFAAGAQGYLLKISAADEVLHAMEEVLAGRRYVTPLVADGFVDSQRPPQQGELFPSCGPALTKRQREVLRLVAEGKSMKEIAAVLFVSVKTVEFHKYRIMAQLGVHSTAQLTKYAIVHGLSGLT